MTTTDSTTTTKADPGASELLPGSVIVDEADLELLGDVVVNSFTAQPSTIAPFGAGSTLKWDVTTPSPRVRLFVAGRPVAKSGTMVVHPATSTSYLLTARAGRVSAELRSAGVLVDTSACVSATIPESAIRARIRQVLDELDRASDDFEQRSPAIVEVDAGGIRIGIRVELAVNNFPNPDVDIDIVLGLRVRNGAVEAYYKSFAVDVDWPLWVTVITLGVSRYVEEWLDVKVERGLKPLILDKVKEQLDAFAGQLPASLRLHTVVLRQDAITVTACPAGSSAPFLVVA